MELGGISAVDDGQPTMINSAAEGGIYHAALGVAIVQMDDYAIKFVSFCFVNGHAPGEHQGNLWMWSHKRAHSTWN